MYIHFHTNSHALLFRQTKKQKFQCVNIRCHFPLHLKALQRLDPSLQRSFLSELSSTYRRIHSSQGSFFSLFQLLFFFLRGKCIQPIFARPSSKIPCHISWLNIYQIFNKFVFFKNLSNRVSTFRKPPKRFLLFSELVFSIFSFLI